MKKLIPLFIGLLLAGCSQNPFNPNMKGMGFWESPKVVQDAILNKKDITQLQECFSTFIITSSQTDLSEYQLTREFAMGIPEIMAQRVARKFKSLVSKEDISSVEWSAIDEFHANGFFLLDSFYGAGRVMFHATKIDNEWVINKMEIPNKDTNKPPLVIFDFPEDELK